MILKRFGLLFVVLLTIFLTSENTGDTHPAKGNKDTIYFIDGGAYSYAWSEDISEHHKSVSSRANASISAHRLQGGWGLSASADAYVNAAEEVKWIRIDGIDTPIVIWPRGEYYLHAHIKKKNDKGRFVAVAWGPDNTIIPVPYGVPITKTTWAYLMEADSEELKNSDYKAKGIGYIQNTNPDNGPQSAGTTASV